MQNNKMLKICSAGNRKATVWARSDIMWSEFVERLKTPIRGVETLDEYINLPKSKQDELKDVGGFVGGTFKHDRRKSAYVEGRDLITLDLDNIPTNGTIDIIKRVNSFNCAACIYSTRKHSNYKPRLRIIFPVDRTTTADEYEPVARKLASFLGMEYCDPTTFEPSRLMYYPSCCKDAEYIYEVFDKPFCAVDGILAMYGDWKDISQWPQVPGTEHIERQRLAKQIDPTTKKGVVGTFCRAYGITEAMDKFIPSVYEETSIQGRYTYAGGSTAGGAVVYDGNLFLYSHHATDPCSGQLVNAFDLIRLHKFADLDMEAKPDTPANKIPSYLAMQQLAMSDDNVSSLMIKEQISQAQEAFAGISNASTTADINTDWTKLLAKSDSGAILPTINNLVLILQNDINVKGKIATDVFADRGIVLGATPWNPMAEKRTWIDEDDSGVKWYIETYYKIYTKDKLMDALAIVGGINKVNAVEDYIKSLSWDGIKRVDTLLADYLGADKNEYTAAVMRKSLCAAVARAIEGGVKFDYMPIITGAQGIGKSTFLNVLGKEWFSDSLTTFEGKEAAELIQGTWINEVGELTAMSRSETTAIKQFLSKKEDIYRAAYGRRTKSHPRRCVFFGTSNDDEFLKDTTGNRRYLPVDVGINTPTKSVWLDLPKELDQIWAESYAYYILGEKLYLSKEIEALAKEQQELHREVSAKEGAIIEFLEKDIPENWYKLKEYEQRQFLNGNLQGHAPLIKRQKVCIAEIWALCFDGQLKYLQKRDSIEIASIMRGLKEWKKMNITNSRFGNFGRQKGFERS